MITSAAEDAKVSFEPTRRQILQAIALLGAAACRPADTIGAEVGETDLMLRRQLERSTFGVTPDVLAEVAGAGGFSGWLDAQLGMESTTGQPRAIELFNAIEAHLPALSEFKFATQADRNDAVRRCQQVVTGRTVLTAAFATDQLRQRVVDVLSDLLHVSSSGQPEVFSVPGYDMVIRAGAFGKYSDLLINSAQHAAMLTYLDQARSRADGNHIPNENYARELMELHTVGVHGGYDEQDVAELAHVLSGWSIGQPARTYTFKSTWHDLGTLATEGDILGWRPQRSLSGEAIGVDAIEHLARHRSTATRIAHRFAQRFVNESITTEDQLVTEAANVYLDSDTAIGPLVRHLLTSPLFERSAQLMIRRPTDLVAHVLRVASQPNMPGDLDQALRTLTGLLRTMGHVPYAWPSPDGAPRDSAAWTNAGAMITRWNCMTTLAESGDRGLTWALDPQGLGQVNLGTLVETLCGPEHQLL